MKLLTLLFISLAISFTVHSQNIVFVKDSIMDGYMRSGFANKQSPPKVNPDKNGMKNGKWKDYEDQRTFIMVDDKNDYRYVTGHFLVYEEGKYENNNRVGSWTFWVIEDKTFKKIKQREVTYKEGKRDGLLKYFYPSGQIAKQAEMRDDTVVGLESDYFPDGKLGSTTQYMQQTPQNKIAYTEKRYYPGGALKKQVNIVQDSLDGAYLSYYENGKTEQSSFFILGKPDSVYKYFYPNGQLWTEKHYKNGLLMNVICNYDQNGTARDKGTLVDGNGTVLLYDQDGKVYDIEYIQKGIIVKNEMKTKTDPFDKK